MIIESIVSRRKIPTWVSWQLVFEWEDVFHELLNVPFQVTCDRLLHIRLLGRFFKKFPRIYNLLPLGTHKKALLFEMNPTYRKNNHYNRPNVIPILIDFYLKSDKELNDFYNKYNNNRIVFVTSREVYDYLVDKKCPLNIAHLPLSLPDYLHLNTDEKFEKDIDFVLIGRQNPVLLKWLEIYQERNGKLRIARNIRDNWDCKYYIDDEYIGTAKTREECLALYRRSKVGLYSTKGCDDDYNFFDTNGFSQVTPRLFEYMATGNHILARYVDNSDTRYFELNKIFKNITSYEEFETELKRCLSTPVDVKKYAEYLSKHYTSERVKEFTNIIKNL